MTVQKQQMAKGELLSRDELDALLHVVDSGALENDTDARSDGLARAFDFADHGRSIRGSLPILRMINDRFARLFGESIFTLLRRRAEISVGDVQIRKFSEYAQSLFAPSSLNLITIQPLRGKALCVFDPGLVFLTVDYYFGGTGRYRRIEDREFSPMERRVTQILLEHALADLKAAWAPVFPAEPQFAGVETNPRLVTMAGPLEDVVVCNFYLELEGSTGSFQLVMPSGMLQPVCEVLNTDGQGDKVDANENWSAALYQDVKHAEVTLSCTLATTSMRFGDLLNLKQGDVLPINSPHNVTVHAEEVPVCYASVGMREGSKAVKVTEMIKQYDPGSGQIPQVASGDNE